MEELQIDRQEVAGTVRGYNDVGFVADASWKDFGWSQPLVDFPVAS